MKLNYKRTMLVGLAFLLTPGRSTTVSPMDSVAAQVHNFVQDYLIPSETRTSFSLISEGFQPLENRLGGPVTPRNHNVMDVTGDRMVLLRGRTYNEYSGLNWYDTLSTRRYLYVSPRFSSLRDALLDLTRPLCGDTVENQTVRVHMLEDSATTLFAPAFTRTVQLEGDRMVLYFNQAS